MIDFRCLISWKSIFIVFLLIVGIAIFRTKSHPLVAHDSIGKILIEGAIFDDTEVVKKLDLLVNEKKLHGLIVEIDSPGGAVVPSYRIHDAIRAIAKNKPVAVVMKSMAASGGYLIATAGDHIVAHKSTITGSIGVLFYQANFDELMNKVGVKPVIFKTGKLKASPLPGEPLTEDASKMINHIMDLTKKQFLDLVLERRNIVDEQIILDIANSGIYLGEDALQNGLIDELGGISEALSWIKSKNIDFPLEDINIKEKKKEGIVKRFLGSASILDQVSEISNQMKMKGFYLLHL